MTDPRLSSAERAELQEKATHIREAALEVVDLKIREARYENDCETAGYSYDCVTREQIDEAEEVLQDTCEPKDVVELCETCLALLDEVEALRADAKSWRTHIARQFPILDGPSIPWAAIAPYEYMCVNNHDQTLERLAERGGLSMVEAIHVLLAVKWDQRDPRSARIVALTHDQAREEMMALVARPLPGATT